MVRTMLSAFAVVALLAGATAPAAAYKVEMQDAVVAQFNTGGSAHAAGKKGLRSPANAPRPKARRRAK
jgi:hypothetical protein